MVSWFWILAALFGGFLLGIIILGVLSFGREEDAYRYGFGDGIKNSDVGPGCKQLEPASCVFFRPGIISPNICAKWITSLKPGKPSFCLADEECLTQGLRWTPRADSDNGWKLFFIE